MKKLLSIVLAVVMTVGLATAGMAVAADDRIDGVAKAVDTYADATVDLYSMKPGEKLEYPLTEDMFTWKSGTVGGLKAPVTRRQITRSNVKPVITGSNLAAIKNVSIEYKKSSITGGAETAVVVIEFVKPLVSTNSKAFDAHVFIQVGTRRDQTSRVRIQGSVENVTKTLSGSDDYVNLKGGAVLEPKNSVRNVEIDLGDGIVLKTNVYNNQKYYGYASTDITSDDDRVLTKYPSVKDVVRIQQVNLKKTGRYVDLSGYTGYVYNAKGTYLGKTKEYLDFSEVYYISSKDLGGTIVTGNSGSSNTTPQKPDGNNNNTTTKPGGNNNTTTKPGGTTNTGNVTVTSGVVDKDAAVSATKTAITNAKNKGVKTATVILKNKSEITIEAFKSIKTTAANAGYTGRLQADTIEGKAVVSRIIMNPANAPSLISNNIKLGGHINNASVTKTTSMFNRIFKNKIAVFSLDQDGTFGMPVTIAARINLSNMNTSNLYFYSYNRSANKYYLITKPNASIDSNGYVHFTTTLAGDIVISEGPLVKK